jgi:hypothetical protein
MNSPHQLADHLEAASSHLTVLWEQAEDRAFYDALDWRQVLATIEEAAAAVAQLDPDIAAQLREAVGWLQTGDGSPPLPEDFAAGFERIREAVRRLRAIT